MRNKEQIKSGFYILFHEKPEIKPSTQNSKRRIYKLWLFCSIMWRILLWLSRNFISFSAV